MASVREWLDAIGLGQYADAFEENAIGWDVVFHLDQDALKDIGVRTVGDRVRLLKAIESLASRSEKPETPPEPPRDASVAGGERRHLTVMFCDLVGSTELAHRMDPEELRRLISAYRQVCHSAVERFEGHVAQYVGDGVMAYFGYPRAHEEDAERSVRAGLCIVEEMRALNARLAGRGAVELKVRIGIATGPVVVGDVIGEGAVQDTAIGETPNVAARLQALAEPNTVVIGPETRRLALDYFEYRDLGEHRLKGLADPIQVWQPLRERAEKDRFEARHPFGSDPLLGRTEELALILRRWEQLKDGEGQVVMLAGEPGIGKSRILKEVRDRLSGQECIFLRFQCSPYHAGTALRPFIEHLEMAAGIRPQEPAEEKLARLEELLGRSLTDVEAAIPHIAQLLSIEAGPRYAAPALTSQERRERTLEVLAGQLTSIARKQPVMMTYEDAQWSDPTSLELLGRIVLGTLKLPVLLLITFRPEFVPPWTGFAHATGLTLNRMSRHEVRALAEQVAGGKRLPDALVDELLVRTDGVPLFVEEIAKLILESGALTEQSDGKVPDRALSDLGIPGTLKDSLMARLDRSPTVRETAQMGAVIGREFPYDLLSAVSHLPGSALQDGLNQLTSAGLIFRRGTPPDARYAFKHALVRDAAYESLLLARRQTLHCAVATALERQHSANLDAECETLAYHFSRADQPDKAIHYLVRSASKAAQRHSHREAIQSLEQALEQAGKGSASRGFEQRRTDIQLRLAQSHYFVGDFQQSVNILAEPENQDGLAGSPELAAEWFFWLGHMCVRLGKPDVAAEAARRAIREAEKINAAGPMGKAYGVLVLYGHLYDDGGAMQAAVEHAARSVALLEQSREHYWQGMSHFYVGMVHISRGAFEKAMAAAEQTIALGKRIADKRLQAYGRFLAGWIRATQRDTETALGDCKEALELAPDATSKAYASSFIGYAYLEARDYPRASALLRNAVRDYGGFQFKPFEGWFRALLAESLWPQDETQEALNLASDGLRIAKDSRFGFGQGWAERCLGRIAAKTNHLRESEAHLRDAVATFEKIGARFELARTLDESAAIQSRGGNRA